MGLLAEAAPVYSEGAGLEEDGLMGVADGYGFEFEGAEEECLGGMEAEYPVTEAGGGGSGEGIDAE
jgi:hypothetical protein